MALTVLQYVNAIQDRQTKLAPKLGVQLAGLPMELRAALTLSNAMTAVCMNVLVAKGVCTDVELAALFDTAVAQAFPVTPPVQPGGPDVPIGV